MDMTINMASIMAFTTSMCVLFTFMVRLMVKAALADFMKDLNGTYVRTILYVEKHQDLERRIKHLEAISE